MFVIKPVNQNALDAALEVLNRHNQGWEEVPHKGGGMPLIVVRPYKGNGFIEAELQFTWKQDGEAFLCDVCIAHIEMTGEGEATCGHLTFLHPKHSR